MVFIILLCFTLHAPARKTSFTRDSQLTDLEETSDYEFITNTLRRQPNYKLFKLFNQSVSKNETVHNVTINDSTKNYDVIFYILASIGGISILFIILGVFFWPFLRLLRGWCTRFVYSQLYGRLRWVRRLLKKDYSVEEFTNEFDMDIHNEMETKF